MHYFSALISSLFFLQCSTMGSKPKDQRLARIQKSKQYADGKFHNAVEQPKMVGSKWGMFREMLFGDQVRTPSRPLPFLRPGPTDFSEPPAALQVMWLGHSTVILELEGKRFLIDPVFEKHASPVPVFAKRFLPPLLRRDQLPRLDAIIISHDHYDHLEMESMRYFADKGIPFFVSLGVGAHLEGWGVDTAMIRELDWWDESDFMGLRMVCTPSQHFSGRGLFDGAKTLWASWSLIGPHHRVHYSGDGGYAGHFKEIGDKLGPFDLTMLENGAYNQYWRHMHMFPEETVQAHLDLRGKALMPVHWGMFNLAFHDWHEPIRRIAAAAKAKEVHLLTPKLGQTLRPAENPVLTAWWEESAKGRD